MVKRELPKRIFIDFRRMMQVMFNLSLNSVKYTFAGGLKITVWVSKNNLNFCFKIEDTGIGIAEQELQQIDMLFGLLDKKLMHNETGIGIGLTISKGIVNAMKGTLKINSKVVIGTVCKVKVPSQSTENDDVL